MSEKVVVTGLGGVSPIGSDIQTIYNNAKNGVCGVVSSTGFNTDEIKTIHFTGEVKDFDPSEYIKKRAAKRLDRFQQFAIYAGMKAFEDSGLTDFDPYRVGVVLGSGMGGLQSIAEEQTNIIETGMNTVSPLFITKAIINLAAGSLAIRLNLHGSCYSVVTACASGTDAIGDAYRLVKYGELDAVLVGGAEATICDLGIQGFNQMNALSNATEQNRASIPFDKERDGFVMGEGSAFLVLESEKSAVKRGAIIYAEIAGFGQTCDAYHITAPMEGGVHAARAMENAINQAGISKEQVGYINAHGTGTKLNDKIETQAIKECFGEHSKNISICSTKSMTGHMLGAAGAMEAILTILSMRDGISLPTINLLVPDEECDLDYTPNKAKQIDTDYAISNSLGFGGHNSSILIKRR